MYMYVVAAVLSPFAIRPIAVSLKARKLSIMELIPH